MAVEILLYVGLAVVLHFVIEYFRRKPQIDNISSKSVLITGCDTGFGNLLAKRLDGLGCRVFAGCYTQKGADELRSCSSSRLETVLLDISKTDSIKKAHQFVVDKIGSDEGLWGLVNNAGVLSSIQIPPEYFTKEDITEVLDVNLLGTIDVGLHFLPLLVKSKGRMVNVSSVAGRMSIAQNMAYHISKHGVESFSDGLRAYMQSFGVHVSIVEPGLFATSITRREPSRARIQKGFDRLPPEDQSALGPEYVDKALEDVMPLLEKGANTNLDWVVDAYQHALFAVNPKKRYSCGWDCRLLYLPLCYMPSCIQDVVYKAMVKQLLPPVPLSKLGPRQQ